MPFKIRQLARPQPINRAASLLILFSLLLFSPGCRKPEEKPKAAKPPLPVTVATARLQQMPVEVATFDAVEATAFVEIKSQVNGQIRAIHFAEGQEVRAGDLLFSLDPAPFQAALNQAEANLARDRAQADFAGRKASRFTELLDKGAVSRQEHEQAATADSIAAETVKADLAAIESARVQLGYCDIRAPLSGVNGELAVHAGGTVKANDQPLVIIRQLRPVDVAFALDQRYLDAVRGLAKKGGAVHFIDNTVASGTGAISMKGPASKTATAGSGQARPLT